MQWRELIFDLCILQKTTVKMSVQAKIAYKFNANLIQVTNLKNIDKLIFAFIWKKKMKTSGQKIWGKNWVDMPYQISQYVIK